MAEEEIEIEFEDDLELLRSSDYNENVFVLDKSCGFPVEHELVENVLGFMLYAPEAIADLGDGTLFDSMLTYNDDVKKYLLKTEQFSTFIELTAEQVEIIKDILHRKAKVI